MWKNKNCMSCTGLDPLFFLFTSGATDNTNAKYSKNFFFSLAHTENTGKRAFFHFCMLGACLCFDNLEKRSLNWVLPASKGGLNMCVYSCAVEISQGEFRGFPQTFIPHSNDYCLRWCFLCMRRKGRCLLMLFRNILAEK